MKKNKYIEAIKELVALTLDREVGKAVKAKTLEEKETYPALCLVTHQFTKAQKILTKYKITI